MTNNLGAVRGIVWFGEVRRAGAVLGTAGQGEHLGKVGWGSAMLGPARPGEARQAPWQGALWLGPLRRCWAGPGTTRQGQA